MPHDTGDRTSRLFTVLSHRYRRVVLYYLREHDEASLDRLCDLVTGWEEAGPGGGAAPVDDETVLLQLHHVHVPALADAGFVAYDREAREVSLFPLTGAAGEILDAALRADTTEFDVDAEAVFAEAEPNGE